MGFSQSLNDAHRRVFDDPDADAPRLAYATLVEQIGPDQPELIRLQVARFARDLEAGRWWSQPSPREQELLRRHGADWAQLIEPYARTVHAEPRYDFNRGFVEFLRTDAGVLVALGEALLRLGPIRHLALEADGTPLAAVLAQPCLRYLRSLELDAWALGDAGAADLARCPHLDGLSRLGLRHNGIGERGIEALAAAPWVRRLRMIDLRANPTPSTTIAIDHWLSDGEGGGDFAPTSFGQRLEAEHGPLAWLHPRSTRGADRYHMPFLPPL